MDEDKINDAAVAAALVFQHEEGMTVEELETIARKVKEVLNDHFIQSPDS